ncbi:hypothetical protein ABUW04_03595 [Streptacidiphilus sp. N1-10]|uniref:PASTA domain-containing protein n=1 Tax=Streptacidiphilus jeojiensis TaxID=3229225 RepID=A0ABV6XGE1_9ACTN
MSDHEGVWTPVVYGRNSRADVWWQVRPPAADPAWLQETVVGCAVAHGKDLREGPRLLLAQRSGLRLVGVACSARLLSGTMYSDGSRDLHCFVGWLTTDLSAGPDWETFLGAYQQSAAEVYERHMSRVWDKAYWALGEPDPGTAVPAPWPASAEEVGRPPGLPRRGYVEPGGWAEVWNGALATGKPLTVVLGWASRQAAGTGNGADYIGIGAIRATPAAPPAVPVPVPVQLPSPPTTSAVPLPQSATEDVAADPDRDTGPAGTGGAVGARGGLRAAAAVSVVCLLLGLLVGYLVWGRNSSQTVGSAQPPAVTTQSPTPTPDPTPTPTPTPSPSPSPIVVHATLQGGSSLDGLQLTSAGALTSADGTTGVQLPHGQEVTAENCRKALASRSARLPAVRPWAGLTVCTGTKGSSDVMVATVTGVQNSAKLHAVSMTVGITAAGGT